MKTIESFVNNISNPKVQETLTTIITWINKTYPQLTSEIKWNQPMFMDHGTFIIAFSVASKHLSVAPERAGMIQFTDAIKKAGYDQSKMMFKIKENQEINFNLLAQIIEFNIEDKKDCTSFWR